MEKKRVPLQEGLIDEAGEGRALLAGRCAACGAVYFPRRKLCLECYGEVKETISVSRTGRLYAFTIVNMPAEHFQPPYAIGWVQFPEGIRVFGQIRGYETSGLEIGMEMAVESDVLWTEESRDVTGYVFRPRADCPEGCPDGCPDRAEGEAR